MIKLNLTTSYPVVIMPSIFGKKRRDYHKIRQLLQASARFDSLLRG